MFIQKEKSFMSLIGNSLSSSERVLVIGAAGLDIVGRMSTIPDLGASAPAVVRPSFGGVARNVAENLARLGQPVSLITAVGNDLFGQQLLDHTAAAGVDIKACLRTSEFSTASYLAVLTNDGRLQFALDDMRIISTLTPAYLYEKAELFSQASLIFVDCNLSSETLKAVFKLAEDAKVPVCADATVRSLAHRIQPYINRLMLVTANTSEAAILTQMDIDPNDRQNAMLAARNLINQGAEIAVIPMAELGVCYATSETSGNIPAIHTAILDPTGAGDALTGTIIFGLVNEIPLDDAIRLGVSASSLTLRYPSTVLPELSLEKLYAHLVI
jgi:pseudouridine kinase